MNENMSSLLTLLCLLFTICDAMAQKKHPMKIALVSVLVEDPVKAFEYYTKVLGFEEVMYDPDNYLAIVKSPVDQGGASILLEPTEPGGIEIAKKFKKEIYALGYPVITFSSDDIYKTVQELKDKGVQFKKDATKTDYGHEAVFDDANGNYIQLVQMD